jgi:N-acetylgalactosamine-N,N'-diacetylbacillosaminyl-diphospho-undecaprenol 4-alpha-N-acetylgalactosaminyltransferase
MCTLLRHSEAERAEFDISLGILDNVARAYDPPAWVTVHQFDCRGAFRRSLTASRRFLCEINPDATVSFLPRANFINALSQPRRSIISVRATLSARLSRGVRGRASRAALRLVLPRAARVIAVSQGVADDLTKNFGLSADRIVAINNPIDLEAIAAGAREQPEVVCRKPFILAVGRLMKVKNFEMLIRAYAVSGLSRNLVIAGDGPRRAALEEIARACGVADRVVFTGFVKNPYALMRQADLFVQSSDTEGFPNALVEAMAVGIPVISTNAPSGPAEILAEVPRETIHGLTFAPHGVLTPPGDTASMVEALRAMEDPERCAAYASKGATRARAFGAEASKNRYWDVIRSLVNDIGACDGSPPDPRRVSIVGEELT